MARNIVTVSICLPKELVPKLKEKADKEGRSVSNYVTMILRALLDE